MQMTFGSLFAGIGGFDLGLERAGMKCLWQCERDKFCNKVLAKHWPEVTRYDDITTLDAAALAPVDLICGGFPCQPFSVAGKRKGAGDDRFLWPAMLKVIETVRPTWVLGENVTGIIGMEIETVLSQMESAGYSVRAFVVPACATNKPQRRDRVWIVGHSNSKRRAEQPDTSVSSTAVESSGGHGSPWIDWATDISPVCGATYGIPNRPHRLKSLGNAVVPQIVEVFGRMIIEAHQFGGTT